MGIRTRGPVRFAEAASLTFGEMAFWAKVRALYENAAPRSYLNWEEWEQFFELARESGLVDTTVPYMVRVKGEEPEETAQFIYGALGLSILSSWRKVNEAKKLKLTPWQFHQREQHAEASERQQRLEQDKADRRIAAERRKSSAARFKDRGNEELAV